MTLRLKYHRSQFEGGKNTNLKELKPSNRNVSWRHRLAKAEALNGAVWSLQTCSLNGRDLLSELGSTARLQQAPHNICLPKIKRSSGTRTWERRRDWYFEQNNIDLSR